MYLTICTEALECWQRFLFVFNEVVTKEASNPLIYRESRSQNVEVGLGNGRGALERWPRKQALTIGRGAGTEQRGEVGLSHVVERIANRNVSKRHPPRHQEVTTLQPLLE